VTVIAAAGIEHWDFVRSAGSVALLVRFGAERGVTGLLSGTGLTEAAVADPRSTVTARQELAVIANMLREVPEPGLGAEVGSRYRAATFGIFGYACLTSPTARDGITLALQYYELSFGFCLPTATVDGADLTVRLALPDLAGPVARFLVERDLVAIHSVLGDMLGSRVPVRAVGFSFADDGFDYRGWFGVAPSFDAVVSTMTVDASALDLPLPQADAMTVALCEEQLRAIVSARRVRTGTAAAVREQLIRLDARRRGIADVARALAMSERTLRRRLAEEGTSFRQLSDEIAQTLAEQMLATGALSVEDVAIRLGYAEASSFIAAFRRWTGMTPARFAREHSPAGRRR
jgi:AraC-like DNA-binding protein